MHYVVLYGPPASGKLTVASKALKWQRLSMEIPPWRHFELSDSKLYKTLIKHGAYETGFALLDNFGLNSRGETVLLDFGELSFVKSVAVKHSPYQYGKVGSETVIVILGGGAPPC